METGALIYWLSHYPANWGLYTLQSFRARMPSKANKPNTFFLEKSGLTILTDLQVLCENLASIGFLYWTAASDQLAEFNSLNQTMRHIARRSGRRIERSGPGVVLKALPKLSIRKRIQNFKIGGLLKISRKSKEMPIKFS